MIGNVTMTNKDGITKSAYDDFNLVIKHKVIHAPNPQTHKQTIIGMDGAVDLTEYTTGQVRFDERQIDLGFRFLGRENERTAMVSRLLDFVHGQKIRYIFNDDMEYFYEGRMVENTPEVDGARYDLSTSIIVEPFKRDLESSAEEWLWDPFDFELGVINDLASLELPSNQYVGYLMIGSIEDYPLITATGANVQIWYDVSPDVAPQVTPMWTINAGQTKKLYDCKILKGEHWFTFRAVNANGSVTVDYRGGML